MFCSKCGKEIMDEAVICPNCGCPTAKYEKPTTQFKTEHTNDWIAITEYAGKAKAVKVWGIISIVLVFGIGVIPGIITAIMAAKLKVPYVTTTSPMELAEFEKAKKNHDLGNSLGSSAAAINVGLWIMFISLYVMGL